MTDKQINTCEFLNICQTNCSGTLEDTEVCHCYELYKQLKRKEQERRRLVNKNNRLEEELNTTKLLLEGKNNQYATKIQECETLASQLDFEAQKKECLEQECDRFKWYLNEIRYQELSNLDIDYDEYETNCVDTEYTNIISLVEEALNERSSEDCRYDR